MSQETAKKNPQETLEPISRKHLWNILEKTLVSVPERNCGEKSGGNMQKKASEKFELSIAQADCTYL